MTILVSIVVILTSIEPILEKCGQLHASAIFASIVTILVAFEAILKEFFIVRINFKSQFKVMIYHKL